jgi:hypothetical protein
LEAMGGISATPSAKNPAMIVTEAAESGRTSVAVEVSPLALVHGGETGFLKAYF